ncbi:NAD-dependent malic enzyme [methanotrophic endosymbiont of Bathymodiolus puteoserpentis (Logatchev)]|jgi:malate dehydrogenase (oxaloacetate-decarboxylating)|uniref:NAD-dependent malic enzyme n=1 Tax=methanotrophic endosymbiont of Bathymodiolus puteoserpentis (Logatchev) TaxID=343235 RepID=UPI0013CC9D65|nr:NAD-dependent malic enzyme [methanotrophic endosymbiont of Bathymodiolus puteoserpentis (Logatchev)]SHE23433.1 NAD-dependent malic enzyme [methanotrophic endosymbiont of Bathymodiolus puteoserpentis (Logatchev)]
MAITKKRPLHTTYANFVLLEISILNKGTAFTARERQEFELDGFLPAVIETIDEQERRVYYQISQLHNDLNKHIFLRNIQDINETLYYNLLTKHLEEMLPIIYTPTVGLACQKFSQIYRRKRGLFVSYPDRDKIAVMLKNMDKRNVKVIVVTDSERILGLGDQGIGGMSIPIGKLAIYSSCGGISPAYTLPITLDVGTNNQALLDDPMYMGWRHKRIVGDDYYNFVDEFIQQVTTRWPGVLVQFEDFAQAHATPLLKKYAQKIRCFNDDIQGTASVTVGTLLAACHANHSELKNHRIVFIGGGSAGCGIATQIVAHMVKEGLTEAQALSRIYLFTHQGLLTAEMDHLLDFQRKFARDPNEVTDWSGAGEAIGLLSLVRESKPTILIGVSGQAGLMTEEVIKAMYANCRKPIVLPLSNPTSHAEAFPEDIIRWTEGNAIVATGSPFKPVDFEGVHYVIAQCNNSYIFPGVGLGVIASQAKHVTENMFMAASSALAKSSPLVKGTGDTLLPALSQIREVSLSIALAVGLQAMEDGVAEVISAQELQVKIKDNFWEPQYRDYRRKFCDK